MTNTVPQDDSNLDITVTEANDLVTIQIQPASFTGTGGGGAVDSVNGLTGDVVLTTTDISEGTNLYYTDAHVDAHLTGGTGVTYASGDISIGQDVAVDADVAFNTMTADMFGVQHFTAKAREAISAGQPVYISGHSGNTPEVMVADFDDPSKMPSFGIAAADIANNNNGVISTYGDLKDVDTTGSAESETWAVGDTLYVNNGKLTNTRPTGASEQIQAIAKIIRVHANNGQMFLTGAGRTNDVPNLDHYSVFIGNAGGVEQRQLDYTDILNTPTIPADQTLSFSNPDLTISNGNTVDLSALTPTSLAWSAITATPTTIAGYGITDAFSGAYADLTGKPDLTDLQDVVTIAPDTGGLSITNSGQTTFEFGSDAKLQWRSQSDGGEINNWVFDNTGADTFTGMHWRTGANKKIFRIEAQAPSGIDPGDNSYTSNFVISGSDNTIRSRQHNESLADLTLDASNIKLNVNGGRVNINDSYDLPDADGNPDQVIATDGSGNLTFVDQSGGGGSLEDLTDVAILNLQNNDILIYNGTAEEWQNTNLGVSVTPTLSGDSEIIAGSTYTVTVTNHATYDDPNYFCEVYEGSTLITTNDNVTDNLDGTLTFNTDQTPANLQARVRCQDFGDLQSEIATLDFETTSFGGNFRYWKFAIVGTTDHAMIDEIIMYDTAGQTGTTYPTSAMTSNTTPTPYVAYSAYTTGGYEPYRAFNGSTAAFSGFWTLGYPTAQRDGAYLTFDNGSAIDVQSIKFYVNSPSYFKAAQSIEVYGSTTGAFTGEETLLGTAPSSGSREIDLG